MGKATGPESVPNEILRGAGENFIAVFADLVVRVFREGALESWRGGAMTPVPKQAKKPMDQDNARGGGVREVLLSSTLGKLYAKYLRSDATRHVQSAVLPTQLGGFPSKTIEFGNHLVHQRAAFYKQKGITSAVIFLDLTAAFHRALPELVLSPPLGETARAVLLGAPSSCMEASDFSSRIQAAILDLIFNACMTSFIMELRKCLIEDGLLVSMQDLDGNPLEQARAEGDQDRGLELDLDGPTWHCSGPQRCSPQHTHHHGHLEKVAARHGLCLNTKKGKTECVVTLAVKGIMEARRALDWQEDHAQLQYRDSGTLRQVDSCKHLGTLHEKHLCRIPEVVRRAKAARTVIGAISKRVLRNTLHPLPVQRQAALA